MIDVEQIHAYTTLSLGSVGENNFRPQQIDISAWLTAWPGAAVSAVFSRPDGQLYTVIADATTSPLTWTPGAADLGVEGGGKLELRIITADGVVGKSAIIRTVTHGSLGAAGDPPTPPAPDWTETVAENATEARTAATDAQQAAQVASDAQQAINTAEPARVEAEQERVTAENLRKSAESDRDAAETDRETAEHARDTADQNRDVAETSRVDAENLRKASETSRGNAETLRGNNETTRQNNESTRQSNESARVSAENTRAAFYSGFNASISELTTKVLEKTSYGVYTGLGITAQSTPNMTVSVATGTIYMANGDRFTPTANTALAITAADATNPRIDIVYVNSSGVISYLAGKAAASPSAPSVPTGGQKLAEISVAANATTIVAANIADRRKTLTGEAWITPTLSNGWTVRSGNTIKYRKDNFGKVTIQGELVPGTAATLAFMLPSGYRPSHDIVFLVATSGGGYVSFMVRVSDGGVIHNTGTLGTYVDLSSISFFVT